MTQVSEDVTLCRVSCSWHSEGLWCLHLQGSNSARTNMHYIGQVELEVVLPLALPHPEGEDNTIDTNMRNHFFCCCCVDRASLYNLVNKGNLVHNLHSTVHTRQSSIQNNKYHVSHKYSCFSWWWAHSRPKHVEIEKYRVIHNYCPGFNNLSYTIHLR
jgi:hypothetical protein